MVNIIPKCCPGFINTPTDSLSILPKKTASLFATVASETRNGMLIRTKFIHFFTQNKTNSPFNDEVKLNTVKLTAST